MLLHIINVLIYIFMSWSEPDYHTETVAKGTERKNSSCLTVTVKPMSRIRDHSEMKRIRQFSGMRMRFRGRGVPASAPRGG